MLRWALTAALSLWLQPALSQNWYEVEIIIFSQSNAEAYSPGSTAESWPESLRPTWPSPLVRLNAETSPSPALRSIPISERQMNNDSYALRVTDGYQLLWHQAWLQPMLPESEAPWLEVQAGAEFDGHYSLEGSLRIYLERFLHLDTDLWLSEFAPVTTEQNEEEEPTPAAFALPEYEPGIPACAFYRENWPTGLAMEIPDLEPGEILENWWFPPFDCANQAIDLTAGLPLGSPLDPYVRVAIPTIRFEVVSDLSGVGPNPIQEARPLFVGNSALADQSEPEPVELTTEIRQIIPMQQSRRMRSGELHYLDHPRLGVLALITPVEAPVMEPDEALGISGE